MEEMLDLGAESRCGHRLNESMDDLKRQGVFWVGRYS